MKNVASRCGPVLLCFLLALGLSGCGAAGDFAVKYSSVSDDADYRQYETWKQNNQLNPGDDYILPTEEETRPEGFVRVTFAVNPNLTIAYYSNEERTERIDTRSACYLMPGTAIYCSKPVCTEALSSAYHFDSFRICTCDSGSRRVQVQWAVSSGEEGPVIQIPEDCTAAEISIVPVGAVDNRSLILEDYVDDSGTPQELAGTWIVNDQTTVKKAIAVSPIVPLKVEYRYDPSQYCYVSSTPGSYYHENGKVIFETVPASENVGSFSVQLRPIADDKQFPFDPAQYPCEHAAVIFSYQGEEITGPRDLSDGVSLSYRITDVEEGYYALDNGAGEIRINSTDPEETETAIRACIRVYPSKPVPVNLPQPAAGGTIEYLLDGNVLHGSSCMALPGAEITMNFYPWNGWIVSGNLRDGTVYQVEEKSGQRVRPGGMDVNTIFTESQQHKPTLTVVLKEGIMPETQFAITTSDGSKTGLTFSGGNKTTILPDWMGQTDRCIFSEPVGTASAITLTAGNDAPLPGNALRVEVQITDNHGTETRSIRYFTELKRDELKIDLYKDPASDTVTYAEVRITVSHVVDVLTYEPIAVANGTVEVTPADVTQPQELQKGDVIEGTRKVRVVILPDSGYYVTGSKVTADRYSDTMTYAKWLSDCKKIVDKHPVARYLSVTLDNDDPWGTCIYTLDGKEVSGTIQVKEGQKLTLEYTLTDSDYRIARSGVGGFFGGVFHRDSETVAIEITRALDGATIHREDYIRIEPKEG